VRRIEAIFDEDREIGIVGPKQRDEKNFITSAGVVGVPTAPKLRGWKEHDPTDHLYKDRIDCMSVSGSAYFIRRTAWQELTDCPFYREFLGILGYTGAMGAFLPTPHYYEETFCSYHARAHEWRVVYDGSVSIGHTWHASSQIGGAMDQQMQRSKSIFRHACAKHGIPCE
jgi:hypothetical protein